MEPGIRSIEPETPSGDIGNGSSIFFDQQISCRDIPFTAAFQHDRSRGSACRDIGQRIGNRSHRLALRLMQNRLKPALSQIPWIDEH